MGRKWGSWVDPWWPSLWQLLAKSRSTNEIDATPVSWLFVVQIETPSTSSACAMAFFVDFHSLVNLGPGDGRLEYEA
jgi:hypothetical protein